MNDFLISIGSNTDRERNIERCYDLLKEKYPNIIFSEVIETHPVGDNYKGCFLNCLAFFRASDSLQDIVISLKDIEQKVGRHASEKSLGIVRLDLDLLSIGWNIMSDDFGSRYYLRELLRSFETPLKNYFYLIGFID